MEWLYPTTCRFDIVSLFCVSLLAMVHSPFQAFYYRQKHAHAFTLGFIFYPVVSTPMHALGLAFHSPAPIQHPSSIMPVCLAWVYHTEASAACYEVTQVKHTAALSASRTGEPWPLPSIMARGPLKTHTLVNAMLLAVKREGIADQHTFLAYLDPGLVLSVYAKYSSPASAPQEGNNHLYGHVDKGSCPQFCHRKPV